MKSAQVHLHNHTLGRLLDRAIEKYPDKEAIVYVDRDFRLTYGEFGRLVDQMAKGLMALGIRPGEKVALWVNTHYHRTELEYLLQQSEAENLFLMEGFRDVDYMSMVYDLIPELRTQQRGFLIAYGRHEVDYHG